MEQRTFSGGKQMLKMLIHSPEHKKLVDFLSLCKKGTPPELLAQIIRCHYDADYLNKEHYAIHHGPLYGYLLRHPLSAACEGDNLETAAFLLEFGLDPDPDLKWGWFKHSPPRQFALGKPQFMKLFDGKHDTAPWWRGDCKTTALWPVAPNNPYLPKPEELILHIMRGIRLSTPEFLLHHDFCKLPLVMQEFICRIGVKREDFASYQEWLAAHGADENLRNIFREAWSPCTAKARKALDNLVLSIGLLDRMHLFSLVNDILSPHDLVGLIVEFQEQYENRDDKQFIRSAMELLLGAMLAQCHE